MSGNTDTHTIKCIKCNTAFDSSYRFCPFCGIPVRDSEGRKLDAYQMEAAAKIKHDVEEEQANLALWRPAIWRLALFGALMLTIPDTALIFIFYKWVSITPWGYAQFMMLDAALGLSTIIMIMGCKQRGIVGELIVAALRMGQL
ncbi:MAG: hypothetical protein JXR97_14610, partial [Planctomycetes bacterium]|nr:hypothetical protein [Planctomycetota bacterium]